jgi:hypothetical protein
MAMEKTGNGGMARFRDNSGLSSDTDTVPMTAPPKPASAISRRVQSLQAEQPPHRHQHEAPTPDFALYQAEKQALE